MTDYATARAYMVDCQVRPNKVTEPRLLEAMRRLPRELCLPPALAARAYSDENVPLGGGRVLTQPMVVARLVQLALAARPPHESCRALVVGAGAGYAAALLDACGATVTALEEDPALLTLARAMLPRAAPSVGLVEGSLAAGWPAGAPWDVILVDGGVPEVPATLAAQLKPSSGRLVAVVLAGGGPMRLGRATLAETSPNGLTARAMFDCAVPPLPQFAPAPQFAF